MFYKNNEFSTKRQSRNVGGLPVFPHSRNWGYGPSGILGVVLVVLLVLLLLGKI